MHTVHTFQLLEKQIAFLQEKGIGTVWVRDVLAHTSGILR